MPEAWARRNSFQFKPARLGAGSMPSRRRISHTVLGATEIPRVLELALDAPIPPRRVLFGQAGDGATDPSRLGRPPGAPRVRPTARNELAVPRENRLGANEKRSPAQPWQNPARGSEKDSVVEARSGLATWRLSTCSWWRSTTISISLAYLERSARTMSSRSRRKAQ